MDTRLVSPAVRRRVGEPSSNVENLDSRGVVQVPIIETDWRIIEAAFAAKRLTVPADYTGGPI